MLDSIYILMNKFKDNLPENYTRVDFPLIFPQAWIDVLIRSLEPDTRLTGSEDGRKVIGYGYVHNSTSHEIMSWEIVEEALQKAEKYDILMEKED